LQNNFSYSIFLSVPAAIVWVTVVALAPSMKSFAALYGLSLRCDLLWLAPWQKGFVSEQAKIQEAFDGDVLELPWNDFKIGAKPDHELVKEYADIYGKKDHSLEPTLKLDILPP